MTLATIVNFPPIEAIRATLNELDTPALDIYTATGLTPSWQQSVREGRAKDPGYTRICKLITWLDANHGRALIMNIHKLRHLTEAN